MRGLKEPVMELHCISYAHLDNEPDEDLVWLCNSDHWKVHLSEYSHIELKDQHVRKAAVMYCYCVK